MVLWHTQRIRIARRKEGPQVLLDVLPCVDAVARKLAVILHRMWIDGTEFNWSTKKAAA
jgi:hypothetical protein